MTSCATSGFSICRPQNSVLKPGCFAIVLSALSHAAFASPDSKSSPAFSGRYPISVACSGILTREMLCDEWMFRCLDLDAQEVIRATLEMCTNAPYKCEVCEELQLRLGSGCKLDSYERGSTIEL